MLETIVPLSCFFTFVQYSYVDIQVNSFENKRYVKHFCVIAKGIVSPYREIFAVKIFRSFPQLRASFPHRTFPRRKVSRMALHRES